jgi:predicted aspartyl protease
MSLRLPFSALKSPPIPVFTVDLVSPDGSSTVAGVTGLVDTAADRTIVPLHLLHRLKLRPVGQGRAQGFGTAAFVVDIYCLRVVVPGVCNVIVYPIEHANEPQILVGRDVLNQLTFTFDGPNTFIEFA